MIETIKQHRGLSLAAVMIVMIGVMVGVDFAIATYGGKELVALSILFNLLYSFLFMKPAVVKFDDWLRKD